MKPRIPEGGAINNSSALTAKQYSEKMKKMLGKRYDLFADSIIKKVAPIHNALVLEIGSGPGWGGISLLKKMPNMFLDGIDNSFDMVAVAKKNAKLESLGKRTNFYVCKGENMSLLNDNHYDLVISRESLHHWDNPEKVFREIVRILKPDGKVCIYDHRRDLIFFGKAIVFLFGTLKAGKMKKHWKSSIAASYTQEEIRKILNNTGLKDWNTECDLMNLIIYKN